MIPPVQKMGLQAIAGNIDEVPEIVMAKMRLMAKK